MAYIYFGMYRYTDYFPMKSELLSSIYTKIFTRYNHNLHKRNHFHNVRFVISSLDRIWLRSNFVVFKKTLFKTTKLHRHRPCFYPRFISRCKNQKRASAKIICKRIIIIYSFIGIDYLLQHILKGAFPLDLRCIILY